MLDLVSIDAKTKAILLGRNIAIDGFAPRPIRVITHIHADHILGLRESILNSKYIVATPITHDLLEVLNKIPNGLLGLYRRKAVRLNYGQRYKHDTEELTLLKSTHIIGSAQVLVESNGYRLGYTGDFKLSKETVIMKDLDVLVIEATYGHPEIRRVFKNDIEDLVIDIVVEGLKRYGRVVIYGYYGKLQEIMLILRKRGISEPFIMNERIYAVTRVAEKYGWKIGNYYKRGAGNACGTTEKYCIFFEHMSKAKYRRLNGTVLNIVLTGHEYNEPVRKVDEYTWVVSFSDHADFDELVEYVEKSQPKLVVIDGSREGYPHTFAKELKKRGWNAVVLPRKQ